MPLFIIYDDITTVYADGLVNAANEELEPGGGVCGAIFKGAGPLLLKDCREVGRCPTGAAIITFAYKLKAKYVIHAVGPVWKGGSAGEEELLRSCYKEAMALASTHDCNSVLFPLISSGIYGYPKNEAFHIAVSAIGACLLTDREINVFVSNFGKESLGLTPPERQKINAYLETGYSIPLAPEPAGKELPEFREFVLRRLREDGLNSEDAAKRANLRQADYDAVLAYTGEGEAPAKEKVLSLMVSLKTEINSSGKYLRAYGYTFDPQSIKDKAVLYFLENGLTDVFYLNEAIHAFTQQFLIETDPDLLADTRKRRKL